MKITQAIKMAFASICSTKLRSFLTMLGIIIGVMSVTVLVSIVQSTTNNVSDKLSQLGGNVISATVTSRRSNKITTSDLKSLENNPAIESVSPIISGSSTAKASGNSSSVKLSYDDCNKRLETLLNFDMIVFKVVLLISKLYTSTKRTKTY